MAAAPLLVVSHSAVTARHLRKWTRLAKAVRWPIVLAVPRAWPEGGVWQSAPDPGARGLKVVALPTWFAGNLGHGRLRGLAALARDARPAALWVEEEPFIPMAAQAAAVASQLRVPMGIFAWENQARAMGLFERLRLEKVLAQTRLAVAGNQEAAGLLRGWGYRGRLLQMPQYGVEDNPPLARPPAKPFTVGYAGRLVFEKGVDQLLRAMAGLPGRLVIAGTGPEEPALRALAAELKVEAMFTGYQDEAGMNLFYQGLHVLALPSRETPAWKEQFGRVLAEAMARGIACVGSPGGAIPEVMGGGGLLAATVPELAAALKKLSRSPALRARLGQAGRRRARKHFTETALTGAMKAELEKLRRFEA